MAPEPVLRIASGAHGRPRMVALKLLRSEVAHSPEMAKRFRSEIKLARRVRHRNVCGIHMRDARGRCGGSEGGIQKKELDLPSAFALQTDTLSG